ncbi:hypothetical protein E4T56_gene6909 [Termitomyces sp. T112]|nr:hypothetical protein E4T56_gene6909 [Termitomyces sp. T112]
MPPLPSANHFAPLSIESNISAAIVDTMPETISPSSDVQTPPPAKVSARNTPPSTRPHIPAWECRLPHHYVVASTPSTNSLKLQVEIETTDTQQIQSVVALLDSGATGLFLDTNYVQQHCLTTCPLSCPIPVYNVDGMLNEAGSIHLGKQDMILGFTWLCEHNPEIDWTKEEAHIEWRAKVHECAAIHACCAGHLPYADLDLLSPPPLAFPYREALYEDVQGVGCESPEEEEGGGEWTHTPETESLDKNIEVGDQIYATILGLPPAMAEIQAIKDTAWRWEPPQQAAFDALKHSVTSKPVLLFPNDDSPFHVEADSSDFATGAVLSQQSKEDGKWHPVAFYSKSLNAVEQNYEIHTKEMLAIIWSFEEWRHFLEGAQHKFEVWTDHKNLEYFRSAKKLN